MQWVIHDEGVIQGVCVMVCVCINIMMSEYTRGSRCGGPGRGRLE